MSTFAANSSAITVDSDFRKDLMSHVHSTDTIVNASIDTAHIADKAVTTAKIAEGSLPATKLPTVTSSNTTRIAASAVTADKIASATVQSANFARGVGLSDSVYVNVPTSGVRTAVDMQMGGTTRWQFAFDGSEPDFIIRAGGHGTNPAFRLRGSTGAVTIRGRVYKLYGPLSITGTIANSALPAGRNRVNNSGEMYGTPMIGEVIGVWGAGNWTAKNTDATIWQPYGYQSFTRHQYRQDTYDSGSQLPGTWTSRGSFHEGWALFQRTA